MFDRETEMAIVRRLIQQDNTGPELMAGVEPNVPESAAWRAHLKRRLMQKRLKEILERGGYKDLAGMVQFRRDLQ
jgi:hypothetical protein